MVQLGAVGALTAGLFLIDLPAAGLHQGVALQGEVLVLGADARIAEAGAGGGRRGWDGR